MKRNWSQELQFLLRNKKNNNVQKKNIILCILPVDITTTYLSDITATYLSDITATSSQYIRNILIGNNRLIPWSMFEKYWTPDIHDWTNDNKIKSLLSVLLSAHVKRLSVSCMRDFKIKIIRLI